MSRPRNVLIFKAVVETGDRMAIERLMSLIPSSTELHPLIRTRFTRAIYDPQTRRDYWIAGNDDHVACVMITGIACEEVTKIRALIDPRSDRYFDLEDLVALAARVTGGMAHLI